MAKLCKQCSEEKNDSEFAEDRRNKSGLQTNCRSCNNENKKSSYDSYTRWELGLRKYNISTIEYAELLASQNDSCALCGKHSSNHRRRLSVDHDHKTGRVRGLLCDKCNKGIGCLGDSLEGLERAIKYLRSSND